MALSESYYPHLGYKIGNIQISAVKHFIARAGVAQLGQRRKTEALIP